jgi:DNA helicase II / ATP-dependent DNA helicase PcrA
MPIQLRKLRFIISRIANKIRPINGAPRRHPSPNGGKPLYVGCNGCKCNQGYSKVAYQKRPYKQLKPAVIVRLPRVHRNWSRYQKDIFGNIQSGSGNTQVDALAGTGKTSTIVEGFHYVPKGTASLMCAFNKSIQTELETRAPAEVTVKTLHSLGYAACRRMFPKIGQPDNNKLEGFIRAERGDDQETFEVRGNLQKAISLCKGYLAETPEEIDPILDRHEIDTCDDSREGFITSVIKIMNATKKDTSRVDFDDMIWFPNVHGIKLTQYGMVFIDEAQDLNLAQINLALNSCAANGRIISVGDEHQAIYGFRGADSNAIQNIVDRMHSTRMPLSVTYRCAKSIVKQAQTLVPALEAAPDAEEGLVDYITTNKMQDLVKPGDFILSRVNAPLLKWCLSLLLARIPANIQGRDIGKSLTALIKKSGSKDVDSFLGWLTEYREMEVERMVKAKRDPAVVEDKVECLRVLCEGTRSLSDVKANINHLFRDGDDKDRVILSSTHKAKGLERDRVFMLNDTYRPTKGKEEANLTYVAYTRAKKELYLVSGK